MNFSKHFQNSSKRIEDILVSRCWLVCSKAILTVLMILSFIATIVAEDFGIPKRNVSFNSPANSVASNSSGTWAIAETAQANGKIGFQANPSSSEMLSTSTSQTSVAQLPNVVRLVAFDQSGQSFGSGSYIGNFGEYGLVLSNWHVIREADGLVHVHFPNGFASYGAVIQFDQKWDLVLIAISKPPQSVPPLPIAQTTPRPGDPLWIAGHGSGVYRLVGGQCVQYLAPEDPKDGTTPQYEIVEVSVSARQGDSGGPILNVKGELAGVLFGSDMVRNTAGSYCERVNRFLKQTHSLVNTLPQRPEMYFASIERGGPRRLLSESQNSTSMEQPKVPMSPRRADFAGSSISFGARSNPRRYTQPVPLTSFSVFEKVAEKNAENVPKFRTKTVESDQQGPQSTSDAPLTPLSFDSPVSHRVIRTAARMELQPASVPEKSIMIPSENLAPLAVSAIVTEKVAKNMAVEVETVAVNNNTVNNTTWNSATVSEHGETIFSVLRLLGLLTVSSLLAVAFQLLKKD